MIRNFTLKEKINYLRIKGTLTFVDGQWVFRGDPQKKCEIREMTHESKFFIVDVIYDNIRGIKVW